MSEEEINLNKYDIDPILYEKLKAIATKQGITIEEYIKRLVSLGLVHLSPDQPESGKSLLD